MARLGHIGRGKGKGKPRIRGPVDFVGQVQMGWVVIWAGQLTVYVGLGHGSPQQSGHVGGWEVVSREQRKALTSWRGREPMRTTFSVLFDTLDDPSEGQELEREIRVLEKLAGIGIGNREPPVVRFNSRGLIPHDFKDAPQNRWVVDALEWGEAIRNNRGHRIRQEATITLLEYVDDEYLEKARKKRDNKKSKDKCSGANKKRYTVKKGDTLMSIAKKQYGRADCWKAIAKLNKIRDPRSLKIGKRLRLP